MMTNHSPIGPADGSRRVARTHHLKDFNIFLIIIIPRIIILSIVVLSMIILFIIFLSVIEIILILIIIFTLGPSSHPSLSGCHQRQLPLTCILTSSHCFTHFGFHHKINSLTISYAAQ